jgi:CheY-like chemotaxis protein
VSDSPQSKNEGIVLLADDNDDDVVLFRRGYKAAGITQSLRIVNDGAEAIKYLTQAAKGNDRRRFPRPALMFLDLKMPGKSGFDVLQWVRQKSGIRDLPIIVLTTSGDLNDVKTAYELGANSFVTKVLNSEEFVTELRGVKLHWLSSS